MFSLLPFLTEFFSGKIKTLFRMELSKFRTVFSKIYIEIFQKVFVGVSSLFLNLAWYKVESFNISNWYLSIIHTYFWIFWQNSSTKNFWKSWKNLKNINISNLNQIRYFTNSTYIGYIFILLRRLHKYLAPQNKRKMKKKCGWWFVISQGPFMWKKNFHSFISKHILLFDPFLVSLHPSDDLETLHISTFSKLMNTFTEPLIIQFGHPCFKWLIQTHNMCMSVFFALTWNDHAIYIHLLQIFSHTVSHVTFARVPRKKSHVKRKGT